MPIIMSYNVWTYSIYYELVNCRPFICFSVHLFFCCSTVMLFIIIEFLYVMSSLNSLKFTSLRFSGKRTPETDCVERTDLVPTRGRLGQAVGDCGDGGGGGMTGLVSVSVSACVGWSAFMRVKVKAGGGSAFPRRLGAPHADHLYWFSAPMVLFCSVVFLFWPSSLQNHKDVQV